MQVINQSMGMHRLCMPYLLLCVLFCTVYDTAKIGIYIDQSHPLDEDIVDCLQKYLASAWDLELIYLHAEKSDVKVIDVYDAACAEIEKGMAAHVTYGSCNSVAIFDSLLPRHGIPHISVTSSKCAVAKSETTIQRIYTNRAIVLRLIYDVIVREDWDYFYLLVDETTEKKHIKSFLQNLTEITVSVRIIHLNKQTDVTYLLSGILQVSPEAVIVVLCEIALIDLVIEKTEALLQPWHDITWVLANEGLDPASYVARWENFSTALLVHLQTFFNRDKMCYISNTMLHDDLPSNMTLLQSLLVEAFVSLSEAVAINGGSLAANRTCMLPSQDKRSIARASSIISSFKNSLSRNTLIPIEHVEGSLRFNLTIISRNPQTHHLQSHTNAMWTVDSGLQLLTSDVFSINLFDKFGGRKLRIMASAVDEFIDEPYVIKCSDGSGKYCGFLIDILNSMAEQLNFTYDLRIMKTVTGVDTGNGSWNGLIGMIQREEADLGIGPISVTSERSAVVDFTYTFFEDRAGILLRTPKESLLLRVFSPFSLETWLILLGFLLCVPPVVWFSDRHSPYAGKVTEYTRRKRNIANIFWQFFTAFNRQSCEFRQRSFSSRTLVVVWVLYAIVLDSMYTAVLTAILTVSINKLPINNIEDLSEDPHFKVTFLNGSNLESLFRESAPDTVYGKIGKNIKTHDLPMPGSVPAAERLMDTDDSVVFMTDSLYLKYAVNSYPDCIKYSVAPGTFNPAGLAFIAVKDGPYTPYFSKAIIKLQEGGFIEKWKKHYWQQDEECTPERTVEVSDVQHFSGAFSMLGGSTAFAIFIILLELLVSKILQKTQASQQVDNHLADLSTTRHARVSLRNQSNVHLPFSQSLNNDVLY